MLEIAQTFDFVLLLYSFETLNKNQKHSFFIIFNNYKLRLHFDLFPHTPSTNAIPQPNLTLQG